MNNDPKQKNESPNFATDVEERPLDPSRNSSDLMGDPSGMTGWTTGNGADTSAEPTEEQPSTENLPGGIVEDKTHHQPTGIPKEAVSQKTYEHNVWKGMSSTKAAQSDDTAEEGELFISVSDMIRSTKDEDTKDTYDADALRKASVGDDSPGSDEVNTESAGYTHPENIGSQEVSGSEPDPSADDDQLANAQAMGTQLNETDGNPEELDIARDIDTAEEDIRTH